MKCVKCSGKMYARLNKVDTKIYGDGKIFEGFKRPLTKKEKKKIGCSTSLNVIKTECLLWECNCGHKKVTKCYDNKK